MYIHMAVASSFELVRLVGVANFPPDHAPRDVLSIPFNSKLSFPHCRLHPASNGNSMSKSHPEYEGHAHHYVITIMSSRRPLAGYGGLSALPHPASYTAAPHRTAHGPINLCPSFLPTRITFHSSYGCLVLKS